MKLAKTTALASALALCAGLADADSTVRFWYHFDNADNPINDLIAAFEEENPDITIEAENIPWNSYYDQLYTAIIGGNAPDAAMVKMFAQPRLVEMGALASIEDYLADWDGTDELQANLLDLTTGPDGTQYYLPVQYVVLYLYYRTDMFDELGLEVPTTCDEFREAANALTRDTDGDGQTDVYGFGFRGGKGGHDHWATFTLGREGVDLTDGITSDAGVAGTRFVADLFQEDGVFPPSAPNDGFQEIIGGFKAGRTAMTIHHIGSANGMVEALGDDVSAAPVPECGGGHWTAFGDESTAIFSSAEDKDAAWKWISFLSSEGHNTTFNEATGQLPVVKADSDAWSLHPQRFVTATVDSIPFANLLPNVPETSDFVNTVWPTNMQRVLTGEISPAEMNAAIAELFEG
ncbi:sugar ABC transporter substrate-binding protein [Psychromarinibacter sp. C21-152]|uniref:Sugar ABC transporter substrate-binding protein n=1 Tax=Psychromarinibacter sediminicola TaxID=3033385 RepID=A0AAE3NW17_9RHOB|nr:sugar ABC transporter substrate-binding protein [Psychromarinibacter sediminicola]MDF0603161.1 sugar ABC transporter substrate-binding protein [Psychromarinibacter sediminicola]